MDKTKEYLALLRKHHFWVICGVVLLASLVSWYLAESRLDKEFSDQKTLVEGQFTALNGIANTPEHPNDKVTAKLHKKVLGIADNVYEAWLIRYNEQQKIPQWAGDLSKPFLDFVNSPNRAPDAEIPARYREEYMNFIRKEIDKLFTQVNARDLKEIPDPAAAAGAARPLAGRGLAGPGMANGGIANANLGVTHEWKGMVAWDESLREALRLQYDWQTRPTTLQVRFANEDLWIYRALLDIIVKTNAQAKEHLTATVKQIDGLYIGQLVSPPPQFIALVAPGAAGGMGAEGSDGGAMAVGEAGGEGVPGAEAPGGAPGEAPGAAPGGEGAAGAEGTTATTNVNPEQLTNDRLMHLRYVDAKGKPLGYKAPAPYAEFKIMPFEMRLLIDQRKIPEFLANCANSPLPVEVRQIGIISPEPPLTTANNAAGGEGGMVGRGGMPGPGGMPGGRGIGGEGGMPGGFPGGGRMAGGMGGADGGMPGGMGGGMGGGLMGNRPARPNPLGGEGAGGAGANDLGGAVEMRAYDLHLEVRGVIYIFNKPDRSKVGQAAPAENADGAAAQAEAGAGG